MHELLSETASQLTECHARALVSDSESSDRVSCTSSCLTVSHLTECHARALVSHSESTDSDMHDLLSQSQSSTRLNPTFDVYSLHSHRLVVALVKTLHTV